MISLRLRTPSLARISRTSSAIKLKRLTTFSGVPVNLRRNASSCTQTPTGQVLEMALAHHDTAHGDQPGGADAKFLGAEDRCDHDGRARCGYRHLVRTRDGVAQAVQAEHLMDLAEAHFPGHAGEL